MRIKKPSVPTVADLSPNAGRQEFRILISKQSPAGAKLPLTHVTDGYRLRDIAAHQELQPKHCKVFNEPLLYFFYGRPAYRPGKKNQPSSGRMFAPICFVLSEIPTAIHRIFPFDSGAVHSKIIDGFHPDMNIMDFLLEPHPDTPRRLINYFYETPEKYLENDPKAGLPIPPLEHEADNYYSLLKGEGNQSADERATTIEIQTKAPMNISGAVQAVIMPSVFADDDQISKKFGAAGIEIIPYDYVRKTSSETYVGLFYQHVRSFIKKQAGQ